ncbi:MAG: hypothetical protein UR31_C0008G0027 [Parcubacteria group bacterium GW2011_GWA2_33_14]|uniref:DUF5652 domain-containing protein n=1 Tax=Candidatus Staskawiczbacteria bacterium RIFCSPHIGHO2_02_FULL_33_16 TaxID=1802204 RepID=A0A1G2HUR7_9BACT|nr:MAG: hypothetical protein UR31_C0008G0027 [Parcubacteria group bacterium GW2011_GWA2_33_14]OGZ65961.1 MAG: hypothetical protein A3D34_01685 [Candidatus Staskawiczbacteria bacterium RIFCSPHIGHO2_02_FULL_33_16]OGZ70542.1 MAG: hypothetical protein A2980_01165 [Candidatus Staskawiczbacteria bacterium RIFCSPLOWO2_01_FULL_33_13]
MYSLTELKSMIELFSDPRLQLVFLLLSIWSLIWKGIALWHSSQNKQRNWFIAILIINTFGILEIVYLFYFQKNKLAQNEKISN